LEEEKMPKQGTRKTFCPNKKKDISAFPNESFRLSNVIQFRPIRKGTRKSKQTTLWACQPFIPSGIRWDTVTRCTAQLSNEMEDAHSTSLPEEKANKMAG
jgi:hypothetical protein